MKPRAVISAALGLQIALDVLLVALVGLAVGSRWAEALSADGLDAGAWGALACGLGLLLVYGVGRSRINVRDTAVDAPRGAWWPTGAWVAALIVGWALLLLLTPVALWIAFPLMFLEMHVLGPRRGIVAVVATTACAIGGAILGGQQLVGSILGPTFGGLVAIAVVLGFETIVRESQGRQELIDDLVRTRADLAASEREAAVATERERLAREIHDTLAQGFSSIELLLRAADAALEEVEAPGAFAPGAPGPTAARTARGYVARSRVAAQQNLAEARRFVRDLAPADLESATLVGALERVAERTALASGDDLRVTVDVSGQPRPLPVPVETALLRIAQSALANVVQHAGATRAAVTLSFLGDAVALDVVDDGRGFDPLAPPGPHPDAGGGSAVGQEGRGDDATGAATPPPRSGFGLTAMRSRVAELGGTFSLETEPGAGTALAVHLPLDPQEAS
ncbi:MAG: sensor histidine kinase [Oerskovia sp.]|nr:sensor histidine kinase [Oerskovia sp.]